VHQKKTGRMSQAAKPTEKTGPCRKGGEKVKTKGPKPTQVPNKWDTDEATNARSYIIVRTEVKQKIEVSRHKMVTAVTHAKPGDYAGERC